MYSILINLKVSSSNSKHFHTLKINANSIGNKGTPYKLKLFVILLFVLSYFSINKSVLRDIIKRAVKWVSFCCTAMLQVGHCNG